VTRARASSLAALLVESAAFRSKGDITRVAACVDPAPGAARARGHGDGRELGEPTGRIALGDDTAAIPDGDGYLLFAAEGLLPSFVERDPYFAGWSSVMVNVNDVAAMGGYPIAVVDVCFAAPGAVLEPIFAGVREACEAYGVPLVGGHTSRLEGNGVILAAAIVGRARHLVTSFGARPGDVLLAAVDTRGGYRAGFPFWNATTGRSGASLRADLDALPSLASAGLASACKDVSNAGVVGAILMMLEASGAGGVVDLERLPRPAGVDLERWVLTFPSFGFVFAARPQKVVALERVFASLDVACVPVGRVDATREVRVAFGAAEALLWDLRARPFTGFGPPEAP
jgi:hypothetical protein